MALQIGLRFFGAITYVGYNSILFKISVPPTKIAISNTIRNIPSNKFPQCIA